MPQTQCPGCARSLRVPDSLVGKGVKCPACARVFAVLAPSDANRPPSGEVRTPHSPRSTGPLTRSLNRQFENTIAPPEGDALSPSEFLAPPQAPGELGRLAQYRVLEELGRGGMGMVFLAEDVHLRRHVALKTLLPTVASSPKARERFLREAQAAAKIEHEHVIAVYQVGVDRDVPFLAMPLLKGRALNEYLNREGTPIIAEVIRIAREITTGLAAAHAQGMIHRDVKPANIWLEGERKKVKVLDFGLARAVDDTAHLTQSGAIVGTPAYMAPEQARGEVVDARADLFSLGCVLYEMCTGQRAFDGKNPMAILSSLALDSPTTPSQVNPRVPPPLDRVVMKLLAKNPDDRYATAGEVDAALTALEVPVAPEQSSMATASCGPALAPVAAAPGSPPRSKGPWGAVLVSLVVMVPLGAWMAGVIPRAQPKHETPLVETDAPAPADDTKAKAIDEALPKPDGWVSLFNGMDLTGWKVVGSKGWTVENQVLRGEAPVGRFGWLMSDREYTNLEIELELKLGPAAQTGVFLRAWPEGKLNGADFPKVQIDDGSQAAATVYRAGALRGQLAPKKPANIVVGQWHRIRITLRGQHVSVAVDGHVLTEGEAQRPMPPSGRLGLQLAPGSFEVRNIRVRELASAADQIPLRSAAPSSATVAAPDRKE